MKKKMNEVSPVAYVVMELGWEYNDEYYYRPESDGGRPCFYYLDKDKAKIECDKLNASARANRDSEDFDEGYGDSDKPLDMNKIDFYEVVCVPIGE